MTCGNFEDRQPILTLIKSAPKLKDWIIKASMTSLKDHDAYYFQKEYCLNRFCCKPSDLTFWCISIDSDTDQFILGIHLYIPTKDIDSDLVHETAIAILKDTLGDEKYNHHIEDIIIHNEIPDDEEILELKELKLYLEDL